VAYLATPGLLYATLPATFHGHPPPPPPIPQDEQRPTQTEPVISANPPQPDTSIAIPSNTTIGSEHVFEDFIFEDPEQPSYNGSRSRRRTSSGHSSGRMARCPNIDFMAKHMCMDCTTPEEAYEYALDREWAYGYQVRINHVFSGFSDYEMVDLDLPVVKCTNIKGMIAYRCMMQEGYCEKIGDECFSDHSLDTGHLFTNSIDCVYDY